MDKGKRDSIRTRAAGIAAPHPCRSSSALVQWCHKKGLVRTILKKIALLPLKLFLLPLLLITATASILFEIAAHLSCYVIGPFLLFLLGSGIYTVVHQFWSQTFLLGLAAVLCVALLMGAAMIQGLLDSLQDRLLWLFWI